MKKVLWTINHYDKYLTILFNAYLYPPDASGGYFGLASATPPPPRVERFSALTL